MKKNKKAFTVAELMVAMSVIGIAAFLVIPISVKSFNKHKSGIVLGRTVEQISLGCQNIMQLANINLANTGSFVESLSPITRSMLRLSGEDSNISDGFADIVRPYWNLENDEIEEDIVIRNFNGEVVEDSPVVAAGTSKYNFSNLEASVSIAGTFKDDPGMDDETGVVLYIDTNGFANSPNSYGRDIFGFNLINDGSLRPIRFQGDADDGLGRTEEVVRDGFKINYY